MGIPYLPLRTTVATLQQLNRLEYSFDRPRDTLYVSWADEDASHAVHDRPVLWQFSRDDEPVGMTIYGLSKVLGRVVDEIDDATVYRVVIPFLVRHIDVKP